MRIESIAKAGARLRVCLEDGSALLLPPALLAEHGLCVGMELSAPAQEALRAAASSASARERAVRILSAAPISGAALRERLLRRGETPEDAQAAVDWLTELRLLDDRQTAAQLVRSALHRGYGPARIRRLLYEKQIPRALWDEALAEIPPQEDAVDEFLRRRFRGSVPDERERRRATDALLRRGHSWEQIRRALARYEPEDE